jgi:hypothetical protein
MRISTKAHRTDSGLFAGVTTGGVALLALLAFTGCKKEEAPPPLPAPEPAPGATAEPLQLEEDEDAGLPKEEVKKTGTGKAPAAANLSACCSALRQNAASAPKPTSDYMLQAAAMCDALAAQGKDKSTMIAALSTALRGANLPSGCR